MLWVQTLTKWQNKNEISINPVPPINIIINGTNFHSFNSLIVSLKGWWCGPKASSRQDNYWQFQLSEFPINLIEPVSHIIYYVEQNLIHHKIVRIYCLNIALQDLYSSPSPPRLGRSRSRSLRILCPTEPTFPGSPVTSMGAWPSLTFFRPALHPAQHHTTLHGVDE